MEEEGSSGTTKNGPPAKKMKIWRYVHVQYIPLPGVKATYTPGNHPHPNLPGV